MSLRTNDLRLGERSNRDLNPSNRYAWIRAVPIYVQVIVAVCQTGCQLNNVSIYAVLMVTSQLLVDYPILIFPPHVSSSTGRTNAWCAAPRNLRDWGQHKKKQKYPQQQQLHEKVSKTLSEWCLKAALDKPRYWPSVGNNKNFAWTPVPGHLACKSVPGSFASELLLGNLAWEPVPGNLFLGTCSWTLETLRGNLA